MYYFQFCATVQGLLLTCIVSTLTIYLTCISPAETGRGGVHEERHDPGDGPQLEGLQTQQAADAEGGPHDREAGETAEAGAGEEAQTETSGEP